MRIPVVAAFVVASVLTVAAADPKSQFFTASDGLKIHYLELGTAGTPVILIHGYTANAEGKWFKSGIAQALATKHRVIAIATRAATARATSRTTPRSTARGWPTTSSS